MQAQFDDYIATFVNTLRAIEVTSGDGGALSMNDGIGHVHDMLRPAVQGAPKVMFVGNGGSAGIAGHMAIDFAKNGGIRSVTFNDASALTCLANDLGYE